MRYNATRRSPAAVATALLALGLANCSGGGGTPHVTAPLAASPSPSPTATRAAGAKTATLSFRIPAPSQDAASASRRSLGPKRSYIGPTTQSITIAIAYGATNYPTITATKQCDSAGANCVFSASAALPVEPNAYTFTLTAYGKSGGGDVLSGGTVTQTLVAGPNVVTVTLGALVGSASLTISGGPPVPSAAANQVFPVTFQAYDNDGSAITGNTPYLSQFAIGFMEIDGIGAFALQPGATGAASCSASTSECLLTSNADTLEVTFNPGASAFPADPGYFPGEFVIYNDNAPALTVHNSAEITTAPCVTPQPMCVYFPSYYQGVLASGGNVSTYGIGFSPSYVAANGSAIWTDAGVITASGKQPAFKTYPGSLTSQVIAGLTYASKTGAAFAPDYSGNGGGRAQLLDSISPSVAVKTTDYPTDTNTLFGVPSGAGIIVGPDGNLWWIDPVTGVLRYTNPTSPSGASSCLLQSDSQTFLTAAQIVPTPPGVTPTRIWFSAIDAINIESYLGYVNVSAGSNSCGAGQAGHYTAFDVADAGTPTPPNGLAVDGLGNAWYDEGDDYSYSLTNIGKATVNPSTGAVEIPGSNPLPGNFHGASQAWGIVYDQLDRNMYFAADNGLIGRFAPSAGIAATTAYALPAPLAAGLYDITSGPETDDESCEETNGVVPGPCVSQFLWDAGTSASGRLTFAASSIDNAIGSPLITNVVVQLDLSGTGISFTKAARGKSTPHFHRRSHRRATYREMVTARP